jgi:D-galactarolactone isomerase
MTTSSPKLQAPAETCDCHMHILYPTDQFPVAPGETAWPVASVAEYKSVAEKLGIDRCIMTQTGVYHRDSGWMLAAMKEFGHGALGTATVDGNVSDAELKRLNDAGIRGACIHMMSGGIFEWDEIPAIAARAMTFDWHLHIQMDCIEIENHLPMLENLSNKLVIDHVGKFSAPAGTDHPGFKTLLKLIDGGRCYVKLSAPYESACSDYPYMDHSGNLATALIKHAPDRMIWGTNWPHLGVPGPAEKPDDGVMMDTLMHWTDDKNIRNQILSDNPARLYGFD